jgi:hypothetical protein
MPRQLPPPIAAGLFSERQIARPLTVALLITLALYPTLMHFLPLAALPDWIGRYLGNGYCRFMLGVFIACALYALLQFLGLQQERAPLLGRDAMNAAPAKPSRRADWIAFLTGRESAAATLPRLPGRVPPDPGSQADWLSLADHLLLLRGQQHEHNFAPIGFVIWVLPMLGFIGTVLGITQAIAGLADTTLVAGADVGDSNAGGGLGSVLGGLAFAFDTTLVGLVLTIPLMLTLLALRARAQTLDALHHRLLLAPRLAEDADPGASA